MALARVYDQKRMLRYPHLLSEDAAIWERFIEARPGYFERVEYDVHVGVGIESLPEWPDHFSRVANDLASKRIDVVGVHLGVVYVVEIKPYAGLGAIGQVIGYELLYSMKFAPGLPTGKMIITDVVTPDLAYLATKLGIVTVGV